MSRNQKAPAQPAAQEASRQFSAVVSIETDDDFHVLIAGKTIRDVGEVTLFGATAQDALNAALDAIDQATLPWAKTWSIEDARGRQDGSYHRHWEDLKKLLRQNLADYPDDWTFQVGGNQTLSVVVASALQTEDAPVLFETEPFCWYWEKTLGESDVALKTGFTFGEKPREGLDEETQLFTRVTALHRPLSVQ